MSADQWKGIIDQLHSAGVLWLTLTGGEPLIRDDFNDIYAYAIKKGFFVTVFTNGTILGREHVNIFKELTPCSIEITLNGIDKRTFESISRVKGSFDETTRTIEGLISLKIPLVLKAVGLKLNRDSILSIKRYVKKRLGKGKFKFDSFILPKLNGDRAPLKYRLSPEEILKIEENDPEMARQREKEFAKDLRIIRPPEYKYNCNAWFQHTYITPSGKLRFCHITDKYETDLLKCSFEEGLYGKFPLIHEEKYSFWNRCMSCDLRRFCHVCPARAFLETGRDNLHVEYYCALAKMRKKRIERYKQVVS